MKKREVIEFFGSQAKTACALGISRVAVNRWKDEIPLLRAIQIEELTGGKLVADRSKFGPTASNSIMHSQSKNCVPP